MQKLPIVSVIITSKNEAELIGKLINSLKKQSYQNTEVILVDNNSVDQTVEIVKKFGVKIYNFGPERSAQRNFGIKHSLGDFVLIVDADMVLQPDVIKECMEEAMKDDKVGGVIIPEQSVGNKFWEKVKAFERSFYYLEGDNTTEAARFFSRKAFDKVGGYDESITGPEDWDFPENVRKKGFKIIRIKSRIFHHERISSVISLIRKKYYYALKSSKYLEKNNIPMLSAKTVYFLRPVFYKNWKILISHPILTPAMFLMLSLEQIAGGLGFLRGKFILK